MSVKRFHFRLKKVSGRQQRLIDAIYSYLPSANLEEKAKYGVVRTIAQHLSEKVSISLESVGYERYSSFIAKLPSSPIIVVLDLQPSHGKAILEIDASIAIAAIDRMLGGELKSLPQVRELTDTEQGVLQFLILQILLGLHQACGRDARVYFRFDRLCLRPNQVRDLASSDDSAAILTYRVRVGNFQGFARLVLPDPFIEEGLAKTSAQALPVLNKTQLLEALNKYSYVRTNLWADAGRTTLTGADISQIERGDIILFDDTQMMLADESLHGSLILRVGDGIHGGFDAEYDPQENRVRCRITGLHKGD